MPANLTPEYLAAEQRFKEAKTVPEKITAVEEMLATIPKHKGTEKMQGELKRKLSKLRAELHKKGGPRATTPIYYVAKEGAGQVALVGAPNTGKSSLLARLTNATPEVADYPFTTRRPQPGMMLFENVQIQLVDLPPVQADFTESWLPQAIRNADAALLVVDLGAADVLEQVTDTLTLLEGSKVVMGNTDDAPLPLGFVRKPTLLVGNKTEQPGAQENFQVLCELWGTRFPLQALSAATGEGLEEFPRAVFALLNVVRIYTKAPGKKADLTAPFVLPHGSTLLDLAEKIHKDFATQLKFARLWGQGKFEGQMIQRDYILQDNDIVELHV